MAGATIGTARKEIIAALADIDERLAKEGPIGALSPEPKT
jgi:hypothetical protein